MPFRVITCLRYTAKEIFKLKNIFPRWFRWFEEKLNHYKIHRDGSDALAQGSLVSKG